VDAVGGDGGVDGLRGSPGELGVEAVDGELVRAPAGYESSGLVVGPGPHGGLRRCRAQLVDEQWSEVRVPVSERLAGPVLGNRRFGATGAFAQHMGPEPGEATDVLSEVGEGPLGTRRDACIGFG